MSHSGARADFFVHPDFHRLWGGEITEQVERYEAAIHKKIDTAELPILIHDTNIAVCSGDLWKRFPPEHRFPTERASGFLFQSNGYINKLNRVLDEREVLEGIVHGSYLVACVAEFKSRLGVNAMTGFVNYHAGFRKIPASQPGQAQPVWLGHTLDL